MTSNFVGASRAADFPGSRLAENFFARASPDQPAHSGERTRFASNSGDGGATSAIIMTTAIPTAAVPSTVQESTRFLSFFRNLSWGAIFAGTVAGLATHLVLTMLGIGIGAGMLDPISDENPVGSFSLGSGIAWCVSALIALWVGGWVAGRAAARASRNTGRLHGFLVWCVATVAMFLFISTTAGMAVSGAAKVVGHALSAAGKPIAAAAGGVGDIAKDAAKQNSDAIASYLDEAMQSRPQGGSGASTVRAKREIGAALTRLFTSGDPHNAEARDAATRAVVDAGVPQADADRMVNDWTGSYDRMKAEIDRVKNAAEEKARVAADRASKAVSRAAIFSFIAFVLGAVVASWGGSAGGRKTLPGETSEARVVELPARS